MVGSLVTGYPAFRIVGVLIDSADRPAVSVKGVFFTGAARQAVVAEVLAANDLACFVQPVLIGRLVEVIAFGDLLLLTNPRFVCRLDPAGNDVARFTKRRKLTVLRRAIGQRGLAQLAPGIVFEGGGQLQGLAVVIVKGGFFA